MFPAAPSLENRVAGTVREVVYRGSQQEVWLDPHGIRLTLRGDVSIRPGQPVEIGLPVESLRVLHE